MDVSEHAFETYIVNHLRDVHRYREGTNADYDRALCLDRDLLIEFITATQPQMWQALGRQHGPAVLPKFLARLQQEITRRGTLDVLRRGIKDSGCYFHLAYFAPASSLNPEHQDTTFETYFNLLKTADGDPRYEKSSAMSLLRRYVDSHSHTIQHKTALMVEHFWSNTRQRIPNDAGEGLAKAMVVTRSRLHAVRYKQAFDAYLRQQGYPIKALVAFSGVVDDYGSEYTEAQMNGVPETQTAERFKQLPYRFLIVAEKFQTGFDQPLLHTMYIDKSLQGVAAVQTLSRLNRIHPRKTETMALDFANRAEDIQQAFEPYYSTTTLIEGTDPNKLYDVQLILDNFLLYTEAQVTEIADLFLHKGERAVQLQPLLDVIIEQYRYMASQEQRDSFKHYLRQYLRLYAFLAQIVAFKDEQLERLYLFGRLLIRKLPVEQERLPLAIQEHIDLESYRINQQQNARIALEGDNGILYPLTALEGTGITDTEQATLSQIIAEINQRFGTDFTDADRVFFAELKTRLTTNPSLQASARVNARDTVQLLHDVLFNGVLQTMIDSNFDMFKRINDDEDFGPAVRTLIFEQVYRDIVRRMTDESAPHT